MFFKIRILLYKVNYYILYHRNFSLFECVFDVVEHEFADGSVVHLPEVLAVLEIQVEYSRATELVLR